MEKGLVSVVIPCYDAAYLSQTVESVLAQTYPRWELIVVDDGSPDDLNELMTPYLASGRRISLIHQANAGAAAARNTGIRQAQGQYLALLDADDVWHPDFLEKQLAFAREKKALCVCSAYGHINGASRPVGHPTVPMAEITPGDMAVMNRCGCLTCLYDMSAYGKRYLDETLSLRDDYAFWYDIVCLSGAIYGNPEVLADYRVYPGSLTGNKGRLIAAQYRFQRRYLRHSVPRSVLNVLRWGMAGLIKFRK